MVQSQSRQTAAEQWQHRQLLVGVEALDAGWLTGTQFAAAMGRAVAGAGSDEALWVTPGLLSEEQLRVVSRRVERRLERSASAAAVDPLLDALDVAAEQLAEGRLTASRPETERYALGDLLGEGTSGRVVRAYDRELERWVAMKLLRQFPSDPQEEAQLQNEARATGRLDHPGIVAVYDLGRLQDGRLYYTMREVPRRTLRDLLEGLARNDAATVQRVGPLALMNLFLQLCSAMEFAHARGVVHLDLKPENIMIGDYGEVQVMDWGESHWAEQTGSEERRRGGPAAQSVGTPSYRSPEQARGQHSKFGPLCDVYALGVILYEMLTFRQPSLRDNAMLTMMAVIAEPIVAPSVVAPDRWIPETLDVIVMRALEKDAEARWPSVQAFAAALKRHLEQRNATGLQMSLS
jgi:serine/threonine-protein kinase